MFQARNLCKTHGNETGLVWISVNPLFGSTSALFCDLIGELLLNLVKSGMEGHYWNFPTLPPTSPPLVPSLLVDIFIRVRRCRDTVPRCGNGHRTEGGAGYFPKAPVLTPGVLAFNQAAQNLIFRVSLVLEGPVVIRLRQRGRRCCRGDAGGKRKGSAKVLIIEAEVWASASR